MGLKRPVRPNGQWDARWARLLALLATRLVAVTGQSVAAR